jgi:FMN phosphatase YigB (HAD superfamily)
MKSIGHRIDAIVTQSARPGNRRIRSLTVDVFDTVVLRDTWPESLQFAEVSASWLPLVRRLVSPTITARELTSYRHYARTLLHRELTSRRDRERDAEVAIEPWFALILDLVARKYGKSLAAESRAKAVGQLIALELKTELRHVRANTALVKELAEARNRHGLRVYFISDMYLSSTHVEKLLKQLGIDLFDGGTTSSELGRGKWSGRAFRAIAANEVFDEFDLRSNIHLGDDRQSDYRSPVAEGSQAILYHSMHHRKRSVARRVGERRLAAQQRAARAVIRRRFVRVNAHLFDAGRIGSLFAPPFMLFVDEVAVRAALQPETLFVAVSSEARLIEAALPALGIEPPPNLRFVPDLNRTAVFRAVIDAVSRMPGNYAHSLRELMRFGEGRNGATELLRLLGDSSSDLLASNMSASEYADFVWARLQALPAREHPLSEQVVDELGLRDHDRVVLVDVGWNGSIQVMVRELASLIGSSATVEGMYLGARTRRNPFKVDRGRMEGLVLPDVDAASQAALFVPEIWEYVLSRKKQYDDAAAHTAMQDALLRAIEQSRILLHCAPDELWAATRPRLTRLLSRPTRPEVEVLGAILWESGFTDPWRTALVDMRRSVWRVRLRSILRPLATAREVATMPLNAWRQGYVSYYGLRHIVPILRLAGAVRRQRYF